MAQVLLEIAQNASTRGMRVDGVNLFSVLDFIMYVCPGVCVFITAVPITKLFARGRNSCYSKTLVDSQENKEKKHPA